MSRFKALTQITLVQVSLCATVVTLGLFIGLIPDHRRAQMEGRVRLCESLGLNGAVLIGQNDLHRWQVILEELVARHDDFVSAGIRRKDGKLVVSIGPHEQTWHPADNAYSSNEFMSIPIERNQKTWGDMELHFTPIMSHSVLLAFVTHPWTRFSVYCSAVCLPVFWLSLRRVLRQFDPSKAVPKHVRSAYDFLAGGLVALNTQRRIVLCNASFTDTVGVPREQLIGKELDVLPWSQEPEGASQPFPWDRVNKDAPSTESATLQISSPLGQRTLMVNAAPVLNQDGASVGTLVGFEDITPLEQTKAELEKSKQAAEAANEAKSAFLANMSHEIRTPMNAILGFADIMRRGLDQTHEERSEYLSIIHSSGEHLLSLINDILDLSKVESGRMQVESIECHPHVVVKDVLATFTIRAREKGLSLTWSARDVIPETITSDPLRLRQILTNLVGNAIKFTEQGGIHIEMEQCHKPDGPRIAFHVADTGIGIASENIGHIFQPFSQADSSTTRRFGGTGLGLSISRRLAELMGGELNAVSEPGQGSIFTVTIGTGDISQSRMLNEASIRELMSSVSRKHSHQKRLPPCRLLVVDDGDSNRHLVRLVMERAGATIDEARDGLEALEQVQQHRYDLILMDVQMPRMDGTTAATRMRQAGISIPLIAMTAHAMSEQVAAIKESGFSHVLTKPVDIDKLLSLSIELLGAPSQDQPTSNAHTDQALDSGEATYNSLGVQPTTSKVARPLPAKTPAQTSGNRPVDALESTLPVDDEDFRAIAEEFASRFCQRVQDMALLWVETNFEALAREAHWLKGAGGTAGFQILTDLGRELELAAKSADANTCEQLIARLSEQANRIWVPPCMQPTTSVSPVT